MQASTDFHAEAEQFRSRAGTTQAEQSRLLLLQLSQAWDALAHAWDSLPAEHSASGADQETRH